MLKDFDKFMSQLKETNATLDFYTDFNKIRRNVQNIEISLNMLNFLLGKDDLYSAVKALWDRDPKVFNVLDILIATRREGKKKFIDVDGEIKLIKTLFSSVDGIMKFFNETGLADFFLKKRIMTRNKELIVPRGMEASKMSWMALPVEPACIGKTCGGKRGVRPCSLD